MKWCAKRTNIPFPMFLNRCSYYIIQNIICKVEQIPKVIICVKKDMYLNDTHISKVYGTYFREVTFNIDFEKLTLGIL